MTGEPLGRKNPSRVVGVDAEGRDQRCGWTKFGDVDEVGGFAKKWGEKGLRRCGWQQGGGFEKKGSGGILGGICGREKLIEKTDSVENL